MAIANVLSRHMFALGPAKMEFILVEAPDTNDTVETHIQHPLYAIAAAAEVTNNMVNPSASVSGKTITIGTNDNTTDILVIVVGY